jgi:outer membrane protein assembly factor BamD
VEDTLSAHNPAVDLIRAAAAVAVLAAVTAGAGCSLHNPYPAGSFERGAYYAERGNNVEAVAALESFVRNNPTDSLAAEAQYLKGMTYMDMGEYPLAAVEFQILRKDYPTAERVEDAFFAEGMAYFNQVGSVERDMTGAYEAREHFLKFLETYPRSPRVAEVHEVLGQISDLLVEKRLKQAHVYRQLGRHEAVALTLDDLLVNEPGSSLLDRVLWERAKAAERLDDVDTARETYERLEREFPDSKWAGQAAGALRRLKGSGDPDDEPTG